MTAQKSFQLAEDLWQQELLKAYGDKAQGYRYLVQGQGNEGTPLRDAYTARYKALRAYESYVYGNDGD